MLKPKYLERLPDRLIELYIQVEMDILVYAAKRMAAFDDFIPAAQWQYKKLIEMGNYHSYIVKALAAQTGKTEAEVRRIMEASGQKSLRFDSEIYRKAGLSPPTLAASPVLQKTLEIGLQRTMGLFDNLTGTTAATATHQFETALDRAWLQINSGGFSHQEAVRFAIKDLARDGIASIEYPTGHVDRLDVAVRRAVLTGVNQAALTLTETMADEMGCDLVEVTAHSGARTGDGVADHAGWQGKVYSRSGTHSKYPSLVEKTGYGTGPGLGGWNCRHSFFPFVEGLSEPAYTKEDLEALNAEKYEYNGKKLTEYEATQTQRGIERNIRRWKREYATMEAAGQPTEEAAARLSKWQKVQRDFLEQTGLKRQYDRERVEGFGRPEASRASAATRRPVLTNSVGQRIIAVKHTDLTGPANSITQRVAAGGNIDRNYHGEDGRQIKQVSSTHHNHKAVMGYGRHGEHAHDYIYDGDGNLIGRPYRELTDDERKENEDIL